MADVIALIVITLWPVIPLWWIPVHGANRLTRKLGPFIYPIVFILWAFCACLIYANRQFILGFSIEFLMIIRVLGIFIASIGILLQLWTVQVLSAKVITGVPEVFNGEKARLVRRGPFSRVRHPTYLSHTLFFIGIFLSTGIIATGIVAIIDFVIVAFIIVPMEEAELIQRFGDEYRVYMSQTTRFMPRMKKQPPIENKTNTTKTINSSKLA